MGSEVTDLASFTGFLSFRFPPHNPLDVPRGESKPLSLCLDACEIASYIEAGKSLVGYITVAAGADIPMDGVVSAALVFRREIPTNRLFCVASGASEFTLFLSPLFCVSFANRGYSRGEGCSHHHHHEQTINQHRDPPPYISPLLGSP
jgi:hypothetical protein